MSDQRLAIEELIRKLNAGDEAARRQLFESVYERLGQLAQKMLKGFPGVKRWEQTDDIWQNASVRLWRSLAQVRLNDERHFHALAALQIRRELIELTRHYYGPLGLGKNYASTESNPNSDPSVPSAFESGNETHEATSLAVWTEFHEKVERLSTEEREVFDLLWYQELTQDQVARLVGVSVRTVKRRWQSARLNLANAMNQRLPES